MSLSIFAHAAFSARRAAPPVLPDATIALTLDRTFTDTPAAGGGNVSPETFVYEGDNWQLWQVVPFLGAAVGPRQVGDCRVQLRDRSIGRGAMQLADMPARIRLSAAAGQTADWTGLPWEFTRPTDAAKFSNSGSGNNARKSIDYEPARDVAGQTPAGVGIAQGETFTVELFW